jgi:drug/metabolite transporter (DMT)-like permease
VLYRWIEVALIAAGLLLVVFTGEGTSWRGAGFALAVQAGLMLGLDLFAERRGEAYLAWLRTLS